MQRPATEGSRTRNHPGGFALLIVLWMLVLIAFIVGYVTSTGRSEIQISTNISANAAASAAADGAVYRAIFALMDPQPGHRPAIDGRIEEMRIGRSVVALRIFYEDDWINPNLASAKLLEGLLRAINMPAETAADLADEITQWVGTARMLRSPDELAAEYKGAALDYAPPEAPVESLEELTRVRGMTAAAFAAMRPHLTLFGGREPNPATIDSAVAAAIRFADQSNSATGVNGPVFTGVGQNARVVRILALAQGPDHSKVDSTAVVRITSSSVRGYSVLSWRSGSP
jgi:general secretion pathway protein K